MATDVASLAASVAEGLADGALLNGPAGAPYTVEGLVPTLVALPPLQAPLQPAS